MDLAVGFAFGAFSFWTRGIWDNPSSDGPCLARGTCNTDVCLGLTPYLSLNLNNCYESVGARFFTEVHPGYESKELPPPPNKREPSPCR
jgi:hypothetical protein